MKLKRKIKVYKEILKALKERKIKWDEVAAYYHGAGYNREEVNSHSAGICSILSELRCYEEGRIEFEEKIEIKKDISKFARGQDIFWDCDGNETKERDQFVWKMRDFDSRIAFISGVIIGLKQIKKVSADWVLIADTPTNPPWRSRVPPFEHFNGNPQ